MYDFAIVGAGMAGASLAAELAEDADVLLLEAEESAGYHTTGRSAAFWEACYGGPQIAPLTLASEQPLRDGGFLNQRGALYIGRRGDRDELAAFRRRFAEADVALEPQNSADLHARMPGLRVDWSEGLWEPDCADIDVAALHQHYLRVARRHGAAVRLKMRIAAIERRDGVWHLMSESGENFRCRTLVNAAGAWADGIAELAGAKALGIAPLLRTVVALDTDPEPLADMPLVLDVNGAFYFKPDAGRLWLSPHDETPSHPHDAAPEELAVAQAIAMLETVVDWRVRSVVRSWAGLRSFANDRLPVFGMDARVPGFAWFAGQGGSGIQTAPAAATLMADLLLGRAPSPPVAHIDAATFDPKRFD